MKRLFALSFLITLFLSPLAHAADMPQSHDYPLIKRFEGSEIIGFKNIPFDSYNLALDTALRGKSFENSQTLEGNITRIVYRIPGGHSSLEIFRNYQQALSEANFQTLYASTQVLSGRSFVDALCNQNGENDDVPIGSNDNNERFMSAKLSGANGKDIYVSLLVGQISSDETWNGPWRPTSVASIPNVPEHRGDIIAVLDVIEVKAMENKMVVIKSSEMADTINKTGKIDIYGITFDVDKTDIKQESTATLVEVSKLLQENPALKLEISGHTDNTGSSAHNQTLSEGRATSVVNALVKQYNVNAARLTAKGYGDTKPVADNGTDAGRAKNRRIELTKLP